jgi:hypothetical protein
MRYKFLALVAILALFGSMGAQLDLGGQDKDKEKEKKKQLTPIPRIVETVDLSTITDASHFNAFLERHSFPQPPFLLARFSTKTAGGRYYINGTFRTTEPEVLERLFQDFTDELAVNENLQPSLDNRWTTYKVTPQRSNRAGNGMMLFHNPDAGYTLQYNFQADFDRSMGIVTIVLHTYAQVQ